VFCYVMLTVCPQAAFSARHPIGSSPGATIQDAEGPRCDAELAGSLVDHPSLHPGALSEQISTSVVVSSSSTTLVGGGDVESHHSQHLSVLHHLNGIRENSDRSVMRRLQGLLAEDDAAREAAGVRAMAMLRQVRAQVDFDVMQGAGRAALQQEADALTQRIARLEEQRRGLKITQNWRYKWFSILLLLCGAAIFCNGALQFQLLASESPPGAAGDDSPGYGSLADTWRRRTERSIVEWALFQTR
jgi:hypothetical protein